MTMFVLFGYGWARGRLDGSTWRRDDDGRTWSFATTWPTDYYFPIGGAA